MIPETLTTGKNRLQMAIVGLVVILVGVAAFGLGRLSALKDQSGRLIIHQGSSQQ